MHVELAGLHLQHFFFFFFFFFTNHFVSLKRKTFCIFKRRKTTEKGARAVGILRQGAGIPTSKLFFPENVYKSRSPADKCRSLR